LGSVTYFKLGEDALDVGFYGSFADKKGFRDIGIGVPPGDEPEDLLFSIG
jgi:hypothetical protein